MTHEFSRVRLRNNQIAIVHPIAPAVGPFTIQGRDNEGHFHLWRQDGRWRACGTEHSQDIVRAEPFPTQAATAAQQV